MKQQTLAMAADQNADFERFRKPTRRDQFLATMERVVPWRELCEVIEPHYPKPGNGRPPVGLERMLRMYFVQHWFNLADQACEEALLVSGLPIILSRGRRIFPTHQRRGGNDGTGRSIGNPAG